MSQEGNSTLLINNENARPTSKELKEALEKGDVQAKMDAMKSMIMMHLSGEAQTHLTMSVIKYCVPQEDHNLKKLLIFFWEVVEKTDSNGKLLPEMILVCNFIRQDLQHPNEYIRGMTLRFLCKLNEREILEPLVSAVVQNLTHRVTFVRRNAVLAVHSIFSKFPQLIPDAPDLIEKFIVDENDVSARRNAFNMLFQCSKDRAIKFLAVLRETQDLSQVGEVFQLAIVDLIRQLIQQKPMERGKYIPIISAILQSRSSAVLYQCATTLLTLSSFPTAIKHAASTFVHILTTHSDNNVRLIVLDRLDEMKNRYPQLLQDSLMDILRALATGNADIRKRIVALALHLVSSKNVEAFVQFLKKELVRSQSEDVGDKESQQGYRQDLAKAIHSTVMKHLSVAHSVVPIMLDYICEAGASAYDVVLFIREVMQTQPDLRDELLTKMATLFSMISSPKVLRSVLWMFSVHCSNVEQITNIVEHLKQSLSPLPLTPPASAMQTNEDDGPSTVATTTVREDGTYVMNIAMVDKRSEIERSDLTGLRSQIVNGDYFLAAALSSTLAKLVVQLFQQPHAPHTLKNSLQVDCVDIMHELVRYGLSSTAPASIDDDAHERIRLALTVAQNPHNEFLVSIVNDSLSAFDTARERPGEETAEWQQTETELNLTRVDQPLVFTQLSKGKLAVLEFEATADDVAVAVSNDALEKDADFLAKLNRVVQLSGFSDPVYCEATVTGHQFDISVELFLVNQTSETLSNLSVELATIGDLKLCERPQSYTLSPMASLTIRANIKVSSTETGVIFGSIVYDSSSSDRHCVILNEIRVDIMDYIKPSRCTQSEFRQMWTAFEWENKVIVNTEISDLHHFVERVMACTNTLPVETLTSGECGFISSSLYAKSLFGEDALINVSVEKSDDNKVEGEVRIRSKTQGIALGLGDIVSLKQKKN